MLNRKDLDEQLKKSRRLAEENDAKRRAELLGIPYLDLISVRVPTEIKAMEVVKEADARHARLVPLQLIRKKLVLAVFDPRESAAAAIIEDLRQRYELDIRIVSPTGLEHGFSYYRFVTEEAREISGKVDIDEARLRELLEKIKTLDDLTAEFRGFSSPLTSSLLEIILGGSMALKSSDIHLEPTEEFGLVRYRIDGLLHTAFDKFTLQHYKSVVMRIKLLSNLKLNIVDEPQDGRFTIGLQDRDIEIRTSIIPSEFGETVVMRLLDPLALKVELADLGWRKDDLAIVKAMIDRPNGLILNTGPTGSGKTTTLYAFLKNVTTSEIKVITVEDPIEYHLEGISQTQVNPDAGYTFAGGLRSILRQDPDVILIGEIRDTETADIALNAALTGHLVFSTLHTNDAVGAIPRFLDLGAKPNILAPALTLVIAQRLVRVLCKVCKVKREPTATERAAIDRFLATLPARVDKTPYTTPSFHTAKGCAACGGFGYRGRTSIFELFEVTDPVKEAIFRNPSEMELFTLAKAQGMVTMQEDGMLKVILGITSVDEVERTTGIVPWLHATDSTLEK